MFDSHLNFRYNIAENVYDGSDGYTEIQLKLGMAFQLAGRFSSKKIDLFIEAKNRLKNSGS